MIKLGYTKTKQVVNRPVKVGKNNKKDANGNTIYIGGAGEVSVFSLGNIEVHVEHDAHGNHLLQLVDPIEGNMTRKLPYSAVKQLKLLEKQAKGVNVWTAFNG
jgi:hypothetical protein